MTLKVLIAAGGTGGHLFPAKQLADQLWFDAEILFIGHKLALSPFFEKEKIPFAEISAHPLKRGVVSAVWKGFWQSVRMIRRFAPDVVVGFGSYHTFPALLAAAALRKKLILFEANCILGKVNRLFFSVADRIAFQFPFGSSKKGVAVPLLPWVRSETQDISSSAARLSYGLDPDRKTILVFGGSQGASFLNEFAPKAIASLKEPVQVIHFTGPGTEDKKTAAGYARFGVAASVQPFEKQMPLAYSAANCALCRSGAGTAAELIRFAVPALLIPYPFAAEDHQRKNGEYLSRLGGARVLVQAQASEERLVEELEALLGEAGERRERLRAAYEEDGRKIHLSEIVRQLGKS